MRSRCGRTTSPTGRGARHHRCCAGDRFLHLLETAGPGDDLGQEVVLDSLDRGGRILVAGHYEEVRMTPQISSPIPWLRQIRLPNRPDRPGLRVRLRRTGDTTQQRPPAQIWWGAIEYSHPNGSRREHGERGLMTLCLFHVVARVVAQTPHDLSQLCVVHKQ